MGANTGNIGSHKLKSHILDAQDEVKKEENLENENFHGAYQKFEIWSDGVRCIKGRAWNSITNNMGDIIMGEQNKSSSFLKRIYFINTITFIRKEDESREAGTIESNAAEDNGCDTIVEVKKEAKEGLEGSKPVIVKDESRDIKYNNSDDRMCREMKEVEEFKEEKDITSVIDHYLGSMVLGKPFIEASGLVYDKGEGTITFGKDNKRISFKMPHKMDGFKHTNIEDLKIDNIPPFVITGNDSD
nr:reverse transcriptase domain-containing protein [Tanacetum cinerariifolium]